MTDNPYQAPVVVENPLPLRGAIEFVGRTCFLGSAVIQLVVIVLAIASAAFDIQRIVQVGIVLILAGAMTATFGLIFHNLLGFVFGVSGPVVCIMCVNTIDFVIRGKPLLRWGPHNAHDLRRNAHRRQRRFCVDPNQKGLPGVKPTSPLLTICIA